MSLYQLWYALCEHWLLGVTSTTVLELTAVILTMWTVITCALVPYFIVRRLTK